MVRAATFSLKDQTSVESERLGRCRGGSCTWLACEGSTTHTQQERRNKTQDLKLAVPTRMLAQGGRRAV